MTAGIVAPNEHSLQESPAPTECHVRRRDKTKELASSWLATDRLVCGAPRQWSEFRWDYPRDLNRHLEWFANWEEHAQEADDPLDIEDMMSLEHDEEVNPDGKRGMNPYCEVYGHDSGVSLVCVTGSARVWFIELRSDVIELSAA